MNSVSISRHETLGQRGPISAAKAEGEPNLSTFTPDEYIAACCRRLPLPGKLHTGSSPEWWDQVWERLWRLGMRENLLPRTEQYPFWPWSLPIEDVVVFHIASPATH